MGAPPLDVSGPPSLNTFRLSLRRRKRAACAGETAALPDGFRVEHRASLPAKEERSPAGRPACERSDHARPHPDRPRGRIVVWLDVTGDRAAQLQSTPARGAAPSPSQDQRARITPGLTRPSDSRVLAAVSARHRDPNVRQLSILSEEDIAAIAAKMGLAGACRLLFSAPRWWFAHPRFPRASRPSSRLQDEEKRRGTLTVDMENRPPVTLSTRERIEAAHAGFGQGLQDGGCRAAGRQRLVGGTRGARSRWVHACACISPISRPGPPCRGGAGRRHPRQR